VVELAVGLRRALHLDGAREDHFFYVPIPRAIFDPV
jgi:hypothetical protein